MFKGKGPSDPNILNDMDGFGTGGPILFYLDGMKEGYEAGSNYTRLVGPDEIELSTTKSSLTFLIDIEEKSLVHHFAEIGK